MAAAGLANQPPREWSETAGLATDRGNPGGASLVRGPVRPPLSRRRRNGEAPQMLDSRVEQKENLARGKLLRRESAFRPTAKLATREVRLRITMPARPARTASFRSDTTD